MWNVKVPRDGTASVDAQHHHLAGVPVDSGGTFVGPT